MIDYTILPSSAKCRWIFNFPHTISNQMVKTFDATVDIARVQQKRGNVSRISPDNYSKVLMQLPRKRVTLHPLLTIIRANLSFISNIQFRDE